ncbi:hypothetical protein [Gemmiger formicilis]|uniref:hypothetical protein n=1 Tax=Gemmiger formicilis TaxID=745368 RepID=UPI0039F55D01|nr:hypothetical protein [Subdoligranulum variabile]
MTTLIRGGLVHDAVHRDACKADILLADGKIAAIGTDLTAPADAVVFDADGLDVFPGFWARTRMSSSRTAAPSRS